MTGHVLVIDDDETTCELLTSALGRMGVQVTAFSSPREAMAAFAATQFDTVVTDLGMREMNGIEVCEAIQRARPDVPVVVVTGQGTMDTAIGALRAGAYDFLTKPVDLKLLAAAVRRALTHHALSEEVKQLRKAAANGVRPTPVIGESSVMRAVYDLIGRVADSDASVLIHGETGTGKELVARAIHEQSARRLGPFVAINCAAVPASLLESELFGHARGAFTDAKAQRTGLFLEARGGTLFLDEIAELPLEVQAKLLRALQERKVRPVGSNAEIPFDARILTATNRDLDEEVAHHRFREDLYYRINVVKFELPPLRDRAGDVLELAQHFLNLLASRRGQPPLTLSTAVAAKLMAYQWPGNVRELENCIERAVALARYSEIALEDLPEKVVAYRPDRFIVAADDPTEIMKMEEVERLYVLRALSLLGNNKTRTATALGFDRRTLHRKLERWGVAEAESLPPPSLSPPPST